MDMKMPQSTPTIKESIILLTRYLLKIWLHSIITFFTPGSFSLGIKPHSTILISRFREVFPYSI